MLLKSVLTYFRQNGNLFLSQEINKIALNISIILFQIFPRFQTHFLPGDTIRCISGGITGNKEKSVILQDFFFSQIISYFFFLSCSPLLLLLFRNSCFFFQRFLMFFSINVSSVQCFSVIHILLVHCLCVEKAAFKLPAYFYSIIRINFHFVNQLLLYFLCKLHLISKAS